MNNLEFDAWLSGARRAAEADVGSELEALAETAGLGFDCLIDGQTIDATQGHLEFDNLLEGARNALDANIADEIATFDPSGGTRLPEGFESTTRAADAASINAQGSALASNAAPVSPMVAAATKIGSAGWWAWASGAAASMVFVGFVVASGAGSESSSKPSSGSVVEPSLAPAPQAQFKGEPTEHQQPPTAIPQGPAVIDREKPMQRALEPRMKPKAATSPTRRRPTRRNSARGQRDAGPGAKLARLDARAQALWRAGRVEAARKTYSRIVRLDPSGAYGELAIGDLLQLSRQHGWSHQVQPSFRVYLQRSPKGRFAGAVRGALCDARPAGAGCP